MTTINPRITAKRHAHLQTLTKILEKFQKDPTKIAGGVAFTRLDTICDGQSDEQMGEQCKTMSPDPDG